MTGPNIAAFYGGYDVSREVGGFDPVNFLRGTGRPIPVREVGLLRGVTLAAFSFLVSGAGRRPSPGSDPLRGRFDGLLSGSFS